MDKLKMAHDWYMKHADGAITHMYLEIGLAWQYADAMQAEADKRESKERPEVLCEVVWGVAPTWAKYWAVREDSDTALWCINKPTVTGDCLISHGPCSPAPSFGFTATHIVERPHGF